MTPARGACSTPSIQIRHGGAKVLAVMPDEKERLLALFDRERRWCQDAEARDQQGNPVCCGDITAVAWDITGALCLLFGWQRAKVLFGQLDRHITRWVAPDL